MSAIPRLYTPRLCLRPFVLSDAPRVQELAGDKRIAINTASIPHPYPDGAAEAWIDSLEPRAAEGKEFLWAITLAGTRTPGREQALDETGHVIGCVGIHQNGTPEHQRGYIGYWLGVRYWNKGFATEAARAVLRYAFGHKLYRRVVSSHFGDNPSSGRVLQKIGMTCEGTRREHICKWGEFRDEVCYGILATEWEQQNKPRKMTSARPALQTA